MDSGLPVFIPSNLPTEASTQLPCKVVLINCSVNQVEMSFFLSPDLFGLEVCFIRMDCTDTCLFLITFAGIPFPILFTKIVSDIVSYTLGGNT